jgi:hypothetical protein
MTAEQVWEILSRTCGAKSMKEDFLFHVGAALQVNGRLEYRFCGELGYGGKLYLEEHYAPRVGCYKEDDTKQRQKMIDKANAELEKLWTEK